MSTEKERNDEIAVDIAIGGPPRKPYAESRDNHLGKGDVSNLPDPVEALSADEHQAKADQAVRAASAEHVEQRGPRKGRQ
jgi:hypothetical protein